MGVLSDGHDFYCNIPALVTPQHWHSIIPPIPATRIGCLESPLFPGYVLCRCDSPSSLWTIPGVLSSVRAVADIRAASEREISNLRRILAAGLDVQPYPFTSQARIAIIEEGPLSGVTGVLEGKTDKRMFVISIQLIRQSIGVRVDALPRLSFPAVALFPYRVTATLPIRHPPQTAEG